MIGQQISLPYLVPRAIAMLEANPLTEGDFNPGDLLYAVLRVDRTYWHTNVEQWQIVNELAETVVSAVFRPAVNVELAVGATSA